MTILGWALVVAVLLVVLYLVRESGETASRSPLAEDPIDAATQARLPMKSRTGTMFPTTAILYCRGCGDEFDLDLYPPEPTTRGRVVEQFWAVHTAHCKPFPTDNQTQKQGAPGG